MLPIIINRKYIGAIGIDIELKEIKEIQSDIVLYENKYKQLDIEKIMEAFVGRKDELGILGQVIKATNINQREITNRLLQTASQVNNTSQELTNKLQEAPRNKQEIPKMASIRFLN